MFSKQNNKPKNLKKINFSERLNIENLLDELEKSANDPYAASLSLMAAADLGDENRYQAAYIKILNKFNILETTPDHYPVWMHTHSFKAWMWGRVLSAADNMQDVKAVTQAKNKLQECLVLAKTEKDSLAFQAWAWSYHAGLNSAEYKFSIEKMLELTFKLIKKYKEETSNSTALSDALWACVMGISASAKAEDQDQYTLFKNHIQSLTGSDTVSQGLNAGLRRTSESNDYPAWALANVFLAANTMRDKELYEEIEKILPIVIADAKKVGASAEYILSVLKTQFIIQLELKPLPKSVSSITQGFS